MNVPVHVLDGVIDDRVLIVALQSFAGFQLAAAITTLLRKPDSVKHEPHGLLSDANARAISQELIPFLQLKCPNLD